MKPEELRIGNWVNCVGKNRRLIGLSKMNYKSNSETVKHYAEFEEEYGFNIIHLKPIPLTEEWLLKFGFTQHHGDYYNEIMMFKATNASRNEWIIAFYPKELGSASYPMAQRFYFVHQLQNLYHALTGEELKIQQ